MRRRSFARRARSRRADSAHAVLARRQARAHRGLPAGVVERARRAAALARSLLRLAFADRGSPARSPSRSCEPALRAAARRDTARGRRRHRRASGISDFSVSIAAGAADELGALVDSYNGLGGMLREERQDLSPARAAARHRDPGTPLAMVLTNAMRDASLYSNVAARQTLSCRAQARGTRVRRAARAALRRRCAKHSPPSATRCSRSNGWTSRRSSTSRSAAFCSTASRIGCTC